MCTHFNSIPQMGTQEVTPQPFPMACPSSIQLPQSHDPATLSKSILQMNNIGAYQLSPWSMSNAAYQSPSLEALQTHMMFQGQMYPSTTSESSSDRPSAEESMLNEALASTGAHFNDLMVCSVTPSRSSPSHFFFFRSTMLRTIFSLISLAPWLELFEFHVLSWTSCDIVFPYHLA